MKFYNEFGLTMRIAQILLPQASTYDRKSILIDQVALAPRHEVVSTTFRDAGAAAADVVHVYGPPGFDAPGAGISRYVASGPPRRRRLPWGRRLEPAMVVSPLDNLPEAVDESYFPGSHSGRAAARERSSPPLYTVGTFGRDRPGVMNMIEQTAARIQRFRGDIEWLIFDTPPALDDLAGVDAWIDPATTDDDFDGFVAEALVAGRPVVASRTPINLRRLDKGMSGFLVPPRDPNELTHAILSALFKSEVALQKIERARQTAGKFRPRQRARALEKIYEAVATVTR